MKTTKKFIIVILMMIFSVSLFDSCQKEIEDPVTQNITYLLMNTSSELSSLECYITIADPAYANHVVYHLDSLNFWQYPIVANNGYPCYFNVYSKDETSQFVIYIKQNDSVVGLASAATVPHQNIKQAELSHYVTR